MRRIRFGVHAHLFEITPALEEGMLMLKQMLVLECRIIWTRQVRDVRRRSEALEI